MYQFTYRIGLQHWSEYAALAQARSWRADRNRRLASRALDAVLAGGLAGLGLYGAHYFFKIDETLAIAMLGAFVIFYGLGVVVSQRHVRTLEPANPKRDGVLLGQRSASITDDAVEIESEAVRHRYTWRAFERVDRGPRMVVLWLEPGYGLIIPRTAFQSDGELAGFVEFANECINQPRSAKRGKPEPIAKPDAVSKSAPITGAAE